MPKKRENPRLETFNKLIKAGKSSEKDILNLKIEDLKEITNSPQNWIKFLDTASNNYKYSFNEQVLIYAQKPDATACADIETWNKKLKRWVNKGARGIALISIENGRNVLKYVFDVTDTHSGINKELNLWEVKASYANGLIETLENSFGKLEIKDNLAQAIYSSSFNLVEDNFQDYLVDLKDVVENSVLSELDDNNLEVSFKKTLINSIAYMVMKRCRIDAMEYFKINDFELVTQFDNKRVTTRLGAAISDIAEQELREIYSSVRNFEKSTNYINSTFENKKNSNYYINENKKIERRNKNERIDIQTNWRLSSTTIAIATNKENAQGKFSRMREKFLKEHKKGLYEELMLDGKMEEHLGEIEEMAQKRLKQIIKSLAEKNQVNEELKATDQLSWVQEMNSIRHQAEEIIMAEIIFN